MTECKKFLDSNFFSIVLHWPWCTHVQRQGSRNTLGVSRPDGSALHHATWRSKHRDKGQTHTTHSESEGAQDLLWGTVTGKIDWSRRADDTDHLEDIWEVILSASRQGFRSFLKSERPPLCLGSTSLKGIKISCVEGGLVWFWHMQWTVQIGAVYMFRAGDKGSFYTNTEAVVL